MARIALIVALVAAYSVSTVLAVDARDAGDSGTLQTVWFGMALVLGVGTRNLWAAMLPGIAIAIAIPYGVPADAGDPAFPLWMVMWVNATFSALLVGAGVFVGQFAESRLRTAAESK
ncbi:MAG: hypothetical protein AB7V58_06235 [Solirubrobacterales bacterium]